MKRSHSLPQCEKTRNLFSLENYFVKTAYNTKSINLQNFCKKKVGVHFHNFHTVPSRDSMAYLVNYYYAQVLE